jgi:putative glutamine amidotransferase
MKKIAIFAQRREHAWRLFNNLAFDYIKRIEEAWGLAILIPAFSLRVETYIDICDAFIFPGWPDIDPNLYGQSPSWASGVVPGYDRFLLSSMQAISKTQKPILGICKGMQLLNIAHGGSLKQDIEENTHHFQPERGYERLDSVIFWKDSFLREIYPEGVTGINSIHHQAVDVLGTWLKISAQSEYDGEIEAIEHTTLPHYGVQWHPEYLDKDIFYWFLSR